MPTDLKVWSDDLWQGVPETYPGDPQGQNYLNNTTKMAFAVFTHSSISTQWNFPEATWCDITTHWKQKQGRESGRLLSQTLKRIGKKKKKCSDATFSSKLYCFGKYTYFELKYVLY